MLRWLSTQLDRLIDWLCPVNLDGFDDLWLVEDEVRDIVRRSFEQSLDENLPAPTPEMESLHGGNAPEIPPSPVPPADTRPQPRAGVGGLFNFLRNRG